MNERVSELKYRIFFDCTRKDDSGEELLEIYGIGKSGYSMYSIPNTQIKHTAHILTPR